MIDPQALPAVALAEHFDLGTWEEAVLLPAGKSQHHDVRTDRGRFILRRSYRGKLAEAVRFEHELVGHLRAHGFPGPEFVLTRTGEPYAVIDGRLWRVARFVDGAAARVETPGQMEAVAEALARYHALVEGFAASVPVPDAPLLANSLRERVTEAAAARRTSPSVRLDPDLLGTLDFALDMGEQVCAELEALYTELPFTIIHGGCRRGSALFAGDRLAVMLDFDSARTELRAYDLAVAVHDFAKIYGDPTSEEFKVHLDPAVAARFLRAYHSLRPVLPGELDAVPLLLMAKRLKRALGRHARLLAGEPLSVNDHKKIVLELARVRSLTARDGLAPALAALR